MELEQMIHKLKGEIEPRIFNHCLNTMEEAGKLAAIYGADVQKAKIAGLLHDCKKPKKGVDNLTHAKMGAKAAREDYNVQDEDIINAIMYHTTGKENMSMLEKIIYIADKTEKSRHFDGVDELRDIVYNDIDEAIILSLENTIKYVNENGLVLDNESLMALKFLKEKR